MPPHSPRLRILSVGGNAVSAFLSWRLSATQACDVTLVWKNGFEMVHQYGLSFKSDTFGNERFKPRHVVRSPEEAAGVSRAAYDYVLLCVKALPDVYDLASVIESAVSPQHTCILVNTTHSLGIETFLEQRFPTNVVLSLISGVEITQLGSSEFEHKGSSELWVGAANKNPSIPATIQNDMAEALSMTLRSGQVDCQVAPNIKQLQYERMIGPIAFHPTSVIFETPSHAELLEKIGARQLVSGVIDEVVNIATANGCQFPPGFREQVMEKMIVPTEANSVMYQDYVNRRPMEVETYLGSPLKVAQELNVAAARLEALYAVLHNVNATNLAKPPPQQQGPPPSSSFPNPRMSSLPGSKGPPYANGNGTPGPNPGMRGPRPGSRAPSLGGPPPGPGRRGPPSINGGFAGPRMNGNGYSHRHGPQQSRRGSMEGNDLEEFSHLVLYNNMGDDYDAMNGSSGDLALREREMALRQKGMAMREREYNMRAPRGGRPSFARGATYDDDDEDGEDYFDPMAGPHMSAADADNLDMMSVTSRRTRKAPSAGQLRNNPEMMGMPMQKGRNPLRRPNKNRTSAALLAEMPGLREELMSNPLVGYSSDRYATVDRMNMGQESRTNSLTAERLSELQQGGPPNGFGPGGFPAARRSSQSAGTALMGPNGRPQRQSPPNSYGPGPYGAGPNGHGPNGRPSPPGGMRQPMPRHPPGHGNMVAPQHIEQQSGVSNSPYPTKMGQVVQVRSLTGSASASAGSGDSNRSARLDSDPSAHSSSSSLGPRPPIPVR